MLLSQMIGINVEMKHTIFRLQMQLVQLMLLLLVLLLLLLGCQQLQEKEKRPLVVCIAGTMVTRTLGVGATAQGKEEKQVQGVTAPGKGAKPGRFKPAMEAMWSAISPVSEFTLAEVKVFED
jgi:hypothetical protein